MKYRFEKTGEYSYGIIDKETNKPVHFTQLLLQSVELHGLKK